MTNSLAIYKDNKLIQSAAFDLTLAEQRIILLCLAKLDSRDRIPDSRVFTVSVDDLHSEMKVSRGQAYQDLRMAVNRLYDRNIYLDPNNPESKMRWLTSKVHQQDKGEITFSFAPEIIPFISDLKTRFTKYKLKDVVLFESSYSFRFYELLVSWKTKSEIKVSVQWIRDSFHLEDKYERTFDIKKFIVKPAIKDINTFSNLSVTFDQIKHGKEITHFVFTYSIKQPKLPKDPPEIYDKRKSYSDAYVGEAPETFKKRRGMLSKAMGHGFFLITDGKAFLEYIKECIQPIKELLKPMNIAEILRRRTFAIISHPNLSI